MKKKIEKRSTWINATFATESDEAKWWFNNRKVGGNQMLAAIRGGQAQILTRAKLLDRLAASKKLPSP